jgi:hypothetical protein
MYHANRLCDAALQRDEERAPTVFEIVKEMVMCGMMLKHYDYNVTILEQESSMSRRCWYQTWTRCRGIHQKAQSIQIYP